MIERLNFERGRLKVNRRAAGMLRERLRFVAREMLGRRYTCVYQLRGSPLKAVIRHPIVDAFLVQEVLGGGEYDIPGPVRQRLADLEKPIRVLDLGGNIGLFGLHMHRQMQCRVLSFEPDPRNAAVLRRCIAVNPGVDWRMVQAAAGTTAGDVEFISDFGLAQIKSVASEFGGHATQERWLPPALQAIYPPTLLTTVPMIDVMPYLTECDLLKIDIEGAEWRLLADPRFADIAAVAIVIEAHAGPEGVGEAATTLNETLIEAGFEQVRPWNLDRSADTVWAVRRAPPQAKQGA